MRPASIILFGRLYAIAILAGLIANVIALFAGTETMLRAALFTSINVALWYLIARRGSVIAKWIFVVLIVLATAGAGVSVYYHLLAAGIRGMLAAITIGLEIACVILVFRPDARAWFRKEKPV